MNLPNKLTIARLGLTVLFVIAAYSGLPWGFTAATLLFGVAAFTDFLDGRIARQRGMVTSFGKLMDPLADKVLMAAAFVVLMDLYRDGTTMPAWLVITVLAREFLVTGLRLVASSRGTVLAADWLGKQKTTWQIVFASYLLVMNAAFREPVMAWIKPLFDAPAVGRQVMVPLLLTITLVITVWSGAAYVWKNRRLVLDEM
ncbi:MAG TPA: CDP-diacylglycerol--glycerol-3-phosphate 3-phosphatidyltransferase [Verrucomicrobiales bacterium]|jgi:CDP-diacylglycerol--glycerol-3-phosphate 3-phosphatidyltransferase|nr:CDP-diacylglycerol--glycerol-3-phosphate 3-phosphatidyltransferase [Verrucomicrobiales bacterium]